MDIRKLVSQMTLEEKAGLCSGDDFWHTKAVERLGIPRSMVSDGPHGLRKQDEAADHLGINDSIKAVCFPTACATAASFDPDMLREMGEMIGDSCQHEKLSVVLGPAVNIKRSPLCGRNFEYFSEDPYLTGKMAAAIIQGIQSRQVGTSIKHFALNSQEHRRMSSSSNADERTMREIYFPAFETAVKEAKPWTVMCSYNRINGVYASENPWLLTDVLRKEWGFEGYVMSDWGAVSDRVEGLKAGLDLEMPSSFGVNDQKIAEAVKAGTLDEKVLDQACERILNIVFRYLENAKPDTPWDKEKQHARAAEMAAECMVLLKNEDGILPLAKEDEIAFIGEFAEKPRFQGGGSSHINCFRTTGALEAAGGLKVTYARGYSVARDETTEEDLAQAVEAAKKARVAVVFAGLPDSYESEGYDRTHLRIPACQQRVIEAVAEANPNTVVVLHNGAPVEMPWIGKVKAVLEAYLAGQAVGEATVTVRNTGSRPGKTVVQLYVGDTEGYVNAIRPVRELKGFRKVLLQPGESKEVTFTLDKRAFATWREEIRDWWVESGEFTIEAGDSIASLPLKETVTVESTVKLPAHYTPDTAFMDVLADPEAKEALMPLIRKAMKIFIPEQEQNQTDAAREAISEEMNAAMMNYVPLRGVFSFGDGSIDPKEVENLLEKLNK